MKQTTHTKTRLKLASCLIFGLIIMFLSNGYSQNNTNNLSPSGIFDKVYDRYGNI
jgi:hypothetical protein